MTALDKSGRQLVIDHEAGALRQNGCRLTPEWWADADAYVDGDITLQVWRNRNTARTTASLDDALGAL